MPTKISGSSHTWQYSYDWTWNCWSTPFPSGLCSPHLSVYGPLIHIEPFFHPRPSGYSSLLRHSCLSAALLLKPKDACQRGVKFLNGKGKKKAIFKHQIEFPCHPCLHLQPLYPNSSLRSLSLYGSPNFAGGLLSRQVYWRSPGLEIKLFLHIEPSSPHVAHPTPERMLSGVGTGLGGTFSPCRWSPFYCWQWCIYSYKLSSASLTPLSVRVRRYDKEKNGDFGWLNSEHQTVNEETWL